MANPLNVTIGVTDLEARLAPATLAGAIIPAASAVGQLGQTLTPAVPLGGVLYNNLGGNSGPWVRAATVIPPATQLAAVPGLTPAPAPTTYPAVQPVYSVPQAVYGIAQPVYTVSQPVYTVTPAVYAVPQQVVYGVAQPVYSTPQVLYPTAVAAPQPVTYGQSPYYTPASFAVSEVPRYDAIVQPAATAAQYQYQPATQYQYQAATPVQQYQSVPTYGGWSQYGVIR